MHINTLPLLRPPLEMQPPALDILLQLRGGAGIMDAQPVNMRKLPLIFARPSERMLT